MKYVLSVLALFAAWNAAWGAGFNVRENGALGDGQTKDTLAIQKAIDAAAEAGGGTVFFPPGVYLTGSIYLKSNVDFYVGPGATLLASPDKEDYNAVDVCEQNSGYLPEVSFGAHLILCIEQQNVTVRGPGKIDGNSPAFLLDPNGNYYSNRADIPWRPSQMLYCVESTDLRISDIELDRAPYWTCFLHGCEQVAVRGVKISTIRTPHTYNGDGIDIDCCRFVTVSDCRINTADDAITLRGGCTRLKNPKPCEYITVTNCVLSSPCSGIRVGVGQGTIRHAVFSNLVFHDTRTAFNFISNWSQTVPRGTDIFDIRIENCSVDCLDLIRIHYGFGDEAFIRDIYFHTISGQIQQLCRLCGKDGRPLKNIRLSDIDLSCGKSPDLLKAIHVSGLELRDVRLRYRASDTDTPADAKPVIYLGQCENVTFADGAFDVKTLSDEDIEQYDKNGRY